MFVVRVDATADHGGQLAPLLQVDEGDSISRGDVDEREAEASVLENSGVITLRGDR